MTGVVSAVEDAFRLVGEGRWIGAPRLRVVHPALPPGSTGLGRPWERDLRITAGAVEGIGYGVRVGGSLRRKAGGALLLLFDWPTMRVKALISDHPLVHAVRSTAPDGVLAKYLASKDATTLGLIGSGRLARWAAEAVAAVRPLEQVRVWSPTPEHRAECVGYLQARLGAGVNVSEAESAEASVREAAIVVTATNASSPVLRGEWLADGSTVITNTPEELDRETLRRGRIVTTYREGVLGHIPPYQSLLELLETGELSAPATFTELADIVVGRTPGRQSPREIVVCLNPAFGVLDAATAEYVYQVAAQRGVGVELEP
jgi:ornithine cyclodeaminase/alanine dehydrogenase-like protein (mu-crystallin family)